jgi:N-acetylglucosaminyldiphosphoundecaprenol N-acetyl-beta-D-mannosaminyltransferase
MSERPLRPDRRRHFANVPLDLLTMEETVGGALEVVESGGFAQHGAVNAAKVVRFQEDESLLAAVAQSEVITADGQSIVWAGRLLGLAIPERVTGIDLMHRLLQVADERGLRVFLLGARPEVVATVAERIAREFPRAQIAGSRNGYFSDEEEPAIVSSIAAAQPHFLFVAIESPKKELFLARNRDAFGSCFAVGVGGTFDVMAGRVKRAPRFAQRLGLEWFFRVAQEPRRLGMRYLAGNTRFVLLVIRQWARKRHTVSDTF